MNKTVNKMNRYLPKSVGVEVESYASVMRNLQDKLSKLFVGGNTESIRIYECQTAPVFTNKPIDVLMLGEVVRRCIPNYTRGGSDVASTSAHCHAVDFLYELEEEHVEALMVGLMPFMSISWNRSKHAEYHYRANVTGTGSSAAAYARFYTRELNSGEIYNYTERTTWIKNQTTRHRKPSVEFRANENSPIWVYFINPILTNQIVVDNLIEFTKTEEFKKLNNKTRQNKGSLNMFSDFIESIRAYIVPILLDKMPDIVVNMPKDEQEFMSQVLIAYLNEDEEEYDNLVNGIINASKELAKTFSIINTEVVAAQKEFDVIKESK